VQVLYSGCGLTCPHRINPKNELGPNDEDSLTLRVVELASQYERDGYRLYKLAIKQSPISNEISDCF